MVQPWAYRTPQPDRDAAQGARPQDFLNRILPSQQGTSGGPSMFKPRQGSIRKASVGDRYTAAKRTPATQAGRVSMQFSGDPQQIAQMVTLLRGDPTAMRTDDPTGNYPAPTLPAHNQPGPGMGGGDTPPAPGVPPPPTEPPPTNPWGGPQPTQPAAINPIDTEFRTLQDYLGAVGRLDLIDENAYKAYSGWTPQLPEMVQAKTALDNQLQQQLVAATGNQETAKAMQKLLLSRMIEDEVEDQNFNKEAAAARGVFDSTIRTNDSASILKDYMRGAGDQYTGLVQNLMNTSSGLSNYYGDYVNQLVGLATEEAGTLFDRGLGGDGAVVPPADPGAGGGTTDGSGGEGYWQDSPEHNTQQAQARIAELRTEIKRIRNKKGPLTPKEKARIQELQAKIARLQSTLPTFSGGLTVGPLGGN